MGAPLSCTIAMLYYAMREKILISVFQYALPLYWQYINDGFGCWRHHPIHEIDDIQQATFKSNTKYGKLQWKVKDRAPCANFLDLIIKKLHSNNIITNIYKKSYNLYTYLPLHSCNSPGVHYGTIYGILIQIKKALNDSLIKATTINGPYFYLKNHLKITKI